MELYIHASYTTLRNVILRGKFTFTLKGHKKYTDCNIQVGRTAYSSTAATQLVKKFSTLWLPKVHRHA